MRTDPFISYLPTLDVHGYTTDIVIYRVSEFINDSMKMGKYKIVVIHGKGTGALKEAIHFNFKRDKRVNKLYLYPFNLGVTILELNK